MLKQFLLVWVELILLDKRQHLTVGVRVALREVHLVVSKLKAIDEAERVIELITRIFPYEAVSIVHYLFSTFLPARFILLTLHHRKASRLLPIIEQRVVLQLINHQLSIRYKVDDVEPNCLVLRCVLYTEIEPLCVPLRVCIVLHD